MQNAFTIIPGYYEFATVGAMTGSASYSVNLTDKTFAPLATIPVSDKAHCDLKINPPFSTDLSFFVDTIFLTENSLCMEQTTSQWSHGTMKQ